MKTQLTIILEEATVNAKGWLLVTITFPMIVAAREVRFVGFSGGAVPAHVGLVGMHGACQAAFGGTARMCLTDEVVKAPEIMGFTQDLQAWVQPGSERFPCSGWGSSVGSGTVLDARTMSFDSEPCKALLPVTCCQEESHQ